jgi:hypothetical protein
MIAIHQGGALPASVAGWEQDINLLSLFSMVCIYTYRAYNRCSV